MEDSDYNCIDLVIKIAPSRPLTTGIYAEHSLEHNTITVLPIPRNVSETPLGFGWAFVDNVRRLAHENFATVTREWVPNVINLERYKSY